MVVWAPLSPYFIGQRTASTYNINFDKSKYLSCFSQFVPCFKFVNSTMHGIYSSSVFLRMRFNGITIFINILRIHIFKVVVCAICNSLIKLAAAHFVG